MVGGQGQELFSWSGSCSDSKQRHASPEDGPETGLPQERSGTSQSSTVAGQGEENSFVLRPCPGIESEVEQECRERHFWTQADRACL